MKQLLSVEQAKHDLYVQFADSHDTLRRIGQLTGKETQVFHALASGLTLSNCGYGIGADVEVIRADGVVGDLRRHYDMPIDEIYIECISESGKETTRVKYIISNGHIEQLNSSPAPLFKQYAKKYAIKKNIHENHDVKRLIERYGEEGAMRRVMKQAFKHKDISHSGMKICNEMVELICECLESGGDLSAERTNED